MGVRALPNSSRPPAFIHVIPAFAGMTDWWGGPARDFQVVAQG